MFSSIKEFCENTGNFSKNQENGLLLVDPNTGSGKTYWSCKAICDYVHNPANKKKIYFTTTLLKNLPLEELKKAYNNESSFQKEVLVIKSNVDFVKENLPKVHIPEEFQSDEYDLLVKLVSICTAEGYSKTDSIYREEMDNKLSDAEGTFRKYIRRIISTKIEGSEQERKSTIRNNPQFQWIGQIYPTVFTDDYKVYLLSISKFLRRNDTLVKPSSPFISADVLKNAIVFIDEFDASKETIQEFIIDAAVNSHNDYLDMVKELHGKLNDYVPANSFYDPYKVYAQNKPYLRTLDSLKEEVESLYSKYSLYFNYKTNDEFDRNRSFLFFDGTFRSYLNNNNHFIRCVRDENNQQVKIFYETKDEYEKNKVLERDINIYSLLRDVTRFLNDFARFIANWAERYAIAENTKRKNQDTVTECYTVDEAVDTICDIYFRNNHLNNVFHELIKSTAIRNIRDTEEAVDDYSFFNRGFKFFEFVNSDRHNEETKVNFIQIEETPEKILLFMAKNTKVVGLSATARIKSVLSNYSLKYLQRELQDSFFTLTKDAYNSLKKSQAERWIPYQNESIKVCVESVDRNLENDSIANRVKKLAKNRDIEKNICSKLEKLHLPQDNRDYYQKRYCNVFSVLKNFIDNDGIESLLCLNMALPQRDLPTFDLNLIELFAKQYCLIHKKECPKIKVLRSGANFEEEKESLLLDLSKGAKVFVFSAYKTIGAGQNLQYKIPEKDAGHMVCIDQKRDKGEKDFDAVYLGDVTNVITNVNDEQKIGLKELLQFLFEIKYLCENDEISPKDMNKLVESGFKAYSKKHDYSTSIEEVRKSASVRRKMTRDVIQAVGRLCRTTNKKKEIFIYTTNALLTTLDTMCIDTDLTNPEMQELFKYAADFAQPLPEEKKSIENEANRKSERANSYIQGMLRHNWTHKSMQLWKELRKCVLKYPTAPMELAEKNSVIGDYYIQNFGGKSNYHFAQREDFSHILVNLFKDISEFKKELDVDYSKHIGVVSEDSARLVQFFAYPGLKEFFMENDFATEFGNKELIMSPALFNNIYKGVLGEAAGRFILERELNCTLKEIEEPLNFEFFDFELANGIYIDFKHWKKSTSKSPSQFHQEIKAKLDAMGARKAYIVNILKKNENEILVNKENRIVEIPWLIDENGTVNSTAIKMFIGELYNG